VRRHHGHERPIELVDSVMAVSDRCCTVVAESKLGDGPSLSYVPVGEAAGWAEGQGGQSGGAAGGLAGARRRGPSGTGASPPGPGQGGREGQAIEWFPLVAF
jgi:hypothetical protein